MDLRADASRRATTAARCDPARTRGHPDRCARRALREADSRDAGARDRRRRPWWTLPTPSTGPPRRAARWRSGSCLNPTTAPPPIDHRPSGSWLAIDVVDVLRAALLHGLPLHLHRRRQLSRLDGEL